VKLVIPDSPPLRVDKGKAVMDGEVPVNSQPLFKLPIRRKPPTCHHCGKLGHIRPKASAAAEAYSGEKDLGPQENYSKGNLQRRNNFRQYFHARSGQISGSTASEGRTRQGRGHSLPERDQTYLVGKVTHA
jgi:hypothetical protein